MFAICKYIYIYRFTLYLYIMTLTYIQNRQIMYILDSTYILQQNMFFNVPNWPPQSLFPQPVSIGTIHVGFHRFRGPMGFASSRRLPKSWGTRRDSVAGHGF